MHYLLVHSGSSNFAGHVRVGLNTAVMPDTERPYRPNMALRNRIGRRWTGRCEQIL